MVIFSTNFHLSDYWCLLYIMAPWIHIETKVFLNEIVFSSAVVIS
jgi:hypothetical protein